MKPWMFVGLAAMVACSSSESSFIGPPEDITFDPSLQIDLSQMQKTAAGTYWQDAVVGQGAEIVVGDSLAVHYTGWLPSGRIFDSNKDAAPFVFEVGDPNLIDGWNDGIPGMHVGGTRVLVIPPSLAYGASGRPPTIPGNSTLVFEVIAEDIVTNP
jgi:FKBP-type peptidyl-prolyl cis-trans isomerase FkpA